MQENRKVLRNGNIELLRMIAMLMVIVLHLLGKGGLLIDLSEENSSYTHIAWILESLSVSCIDIYILVSGYFLTESKFKFGRFFELIFLVMFYSVGITLVSAAFGIVDLSTYGIHDFLEVVLPIHMDVYWFMTTYILLYILSPILAKGVKHITKTQHKLIILLLLIYECIIKSILPVVTEIEDHGYGVGWYITVFIIASYIRLYGINFLDSVKKGLILYFGATAFIYIEYMLVQLVYAKTGRLSYISFEMYAYNHAFVILASVGLVEAFLHMKPMKEGMTRFICLLSPMTLSVYLIHEHLTIRYEWQKWLHVMELRNLPWPLYLLGIIITALIVYCAGTVIDYVRIKIFDLCKLIIGKLGLLKVLAKWDDAVNGTENQ